VIKTYGYWPQLCSGYQGVATHIRTNVHDANIYVDGQYAGTGQAEIKRMGFSKTSSVRVEHQGVVVHRELKREFTVNTAIVGLFTYCTGFFWAWEYPSEIHFLLSHKKSPDHGNWSSGRGGYDWSKPMYTPPEKTEKREKNAETWTRNRRKKTTETGPKSLKRSAKKVDAKPKPKTASVQKASKQKAAQSDPWLAPLNNETSTAD
jgi:hypothetical protein